MTPNPPRCAAQRWVRLQQGILTKGGNSSDSLAVGMTKGECLISTACIQHVCAAKSWPSLASLSTCCLNSRKAAAWGMLASVAAGRSQVASAACEVTPRSTPGHPWNHLGQGRSPLPRPRKKSSQCYFVSTPT